MLTGQPTWSMIRPLAIAIAVVRSGVAVLLVMMIFVSPALTQTVPTTLRVETFIVPPFVIEQDGKPTGFSIELWEEVAARLKTKSNYQLATEVAAGFDALRSQKADLIASGVLITPERDKEFDFSYAILEVGQQVMVRNAGDTILANPFLDLLGLLLTKTTLLWLGIAVLFMLIPAHLVWFLEHRYKDGIIPTENYIPGIFYAMHWSATTLLTQAEQTPRQPLARVISFVWMFTGIVFVALYTAQLTANLTVHQIRGAINGPEDLPGKQVGTVRGASIPINYLRGHNGKVQEFPRSVKCFKPCSIKRWMRYSFLRQSFATMQRMRAGDWLSWSVPSSTSARRVSSLQKAVHCGGKSIRRWSRSGKTAPISGSTINGSEASDVLRLMTGRRRSSPNRISFAPADRFPLIHSMSCQREHCECFRAHVDQDQA
jgi:polar amino acid transport system substrate-binding protein